MTNILCLFKATKRLFPTHARLQNFWPRAGSHVVCLAAADLGTVQEQWAGLQEMVLRPPSDLTSRQIASLLRSCPNESLDLLHVFSKDNATTLSMQVEMAPSDEERTL